MVILILVLQSQLNYRIFMVSRQDYGHLFAMRLVDNDIL